MRSVDSCARTQEVRSTRIASNALPRWGSGEIFLPNTAFTAASGLERHPDADEAPTLDDVELHDGEKLQDRAGRAPPMPSDRPATRGRTPSTACPAASSSISMLGDADGNGPGGFAVLDATNFERASAAGRTRRRGPAVQLRLLVPAAPQRDGLQRVGAPNTFEPRLQARRRRGREVRPPAPLLGPARSAVTQTIDLGRRGLIPLEVRCHHNPDATPGFVGAALSSAMCAVGTGERRSVGGRAR